MRRYVIAPDGQTVERPADRGESLPAGRVFRSARPVRPGARICRVPIGAVDRGDLSAAPDLLARLIEAAGGLSLRAWLAQTLDEADAHALARDAASLGASEAKGSRRTAVTIALTPQKFAEFQAARTAYGVPLAAIARQAVRASVWNASNAKRPPTCGTT